jgi:hypothetical protein
VLLAYLDALRRRVAADVDTTQDKKLPEGGEQLRAAFQEATQLLAATFPDQIDRALRWVLYCWDKQDMIRACIDSIQ